MHFLFGFLVFLYFITRTVFRWGRRRAHRIDLYRHSTEALQDLVRQHGGSVYSNGWRRLVYATADGSVELQIDPDTNRLVFRLKKPVSGHFSFYRLPRMVYAFVEAFLEPRYQLENTTYLIGSRSAGMLEKLQGRQSFESIIQKLNLFGFSGKIGPHGMKLWKRLMLQDLNDLTLMNYIRMAQDFAAICDTEYIHIPVQQVTSEKRCAYCKELLTESEAVQYCKSCGTPHHKECFELNGKCSVYGCEPELVTPVRQTV